MVIHNVVIYLICPAIFFPLRYPLCWTDTDWFCRLKSWVRFWHCPVKSLDIHWLTAATVLTGYSSLQEKLWNGLERYVVMVTHITVINWKVDFKLPESLFSNTVTLQGQNMQTEDTAVYYCARQSQWQRAATAFFKNHTNTRHTNTQLCTKIFSISDPVSVI